MNYKNIDAVPPLKVCRICLCKDGKFYDFFQNNLTEIYLSFSGLLVTPYDGLPQFICSICRFLLYKSYKFKKKCHDATLFLRNKMTRKHIACLTYDHFETPRAKSFNHEFATTEAICYYSPPTDKNAIYLGEVEEESIKTESDKEELDTINDASTNSYKAIDPIPIDTNAGNVNTEHVIKLDVETILKKCLEINKARRNDCSDDDYLENDDCTAEAFTNFDVITSADEEMKECEIKVEKENELHCYEDFNNVYLLDAGCVAEVISSCEDVKKEDDKIANVKATVMPKHEEKYISKKVFLRKYQNIKYFGKKKDFYEHIYKKYVGKTSRGASSDFNHDLDALFDVNDSSDDYESDSSQKNIPIAKEDLNYNQDRFYDYIAKKYTKKTREYYEKQKDIIKFSKTYNMDIFIMNEEEQKADLEFNKQNTKYVNSKYKCELCLRGFLTEQVHQNHMVLHDPSSGKYKCDICHTRFRLKRILKRHITSRHKYKFQCKSCKQVVRNSSLAKEHFKYHEGFKYKCEPCGKFFSKYGTLMNHKRVFHGSVACDICGLRVTANGLKVHKTKAHREMFKCPTCGVQFHNSDALKLHRDSLGDKECGENIRPCTICGDNFPSDDFLQHHNEELHIERLRNRKDRKNKLTLKIGTKPNVMWRMKRRKVTNDDTGESEMQDVDGVLTSKRERQDKVKLVCEVCGAEGFTSPCTLRYHQRIHTGEKPHRCTLCDKSFRLRVQLQKHIRTHTGDRPYKCSQCPKAFKTQSALYPHQTVHTKVRSHKCHLCDKMFLSATYVKMHIKTVHMKKPRGVGKKATSLEGVDNNY